MRSMNILRNPVTASTIPDRESPVFTRGAGVDAWLLHHIESIYFRKRQSNLPFAFFHFQYSHLRRRGMTCRRWETEFFILPRDFFISNVIPAEEESDLPEVGNRVFILPRALWSISINRICYYFQRRIMLLLTKQSMLFLKSLS